MTNVLLPFASLVSRLHHIWAVVVANRERGKGGPSFYGQ